MKPIISFKKTAQVIVITAIMISSVLIAKQMIKDVKHEYSMLPAGSGKACLFEIMR